MLYDFVQDFPHEIVFEKEGPFLSLYQRTHRFRPDNEQDVIRFKNLVRQAKEKLAANYPQVDAEVMLKPLQAIIGDSLFWNHMADGLALLLSPKSCVVYRLQDKVEERLVVSDFFHLKPLIKHFQSADRYQVLGLDRTQFALFEGNRYQMEQVVLDPDLPLTIEEVLGEQLTDPRLSYGYRDGARKSPIYHGHGGKKDALDADLPRYFSYVDDLVTDSYSKPTGLPLLLMALDEYHAPFRQVSDNPYLLDQGVSKDYKNLSLEEVRDLSWQVMQPVYEGKIKKLVDAFHEKEAKKTASPHLDQVVKALRDGRVDTLLLEADRPILGRMDFSSGQVELGQDLEGAYNLLDELAERVVVQKEGGVRLLILPKEDMPSDTGLAALYRY